ncbi:hypothetical protein PPJ95_07790 [Limosilactobacillus reuteri]|uniref:hypothetical protein n=1 Tax=Limosilactobacillus reuteri TaxID=1598 RepID=UPI00234BC401|nr:hypothetical protein [Limosilactobacillus reuteri]MDC6077460.1 hypothetical protein [Limosilactobacillus reuteri]
MLHTYRKTALIEAEQFDGTKDKYQIVDKAELTYAYYQGGSRYFLPTREGLTAINKYGDYIATGVDGEHWVIDQDIFEQTYERCD